MKPEPFLLKPCGKDYLWGGSRLNDDYTKCIDMDPLAETWECSTHPDGLSIVDSGIYKGKTLHNVLTEHPEYLGLHMQSIGDLPILVKLIDAKNKLSVQVHPDDIYANINENGQLGKTEMWYVLDAKRESRLVYGLSHTTNSDVILRSIEDGTLEKYLQSIPVKKDDVFFIEAGTIHAIGEGILVAEIQENSNLTYRLYDYNRIDKNGLKRELHIAKALEVANLNGMSQPLQPMRVLKYRPGVACELLSSCKYFEVYRMIVNTERRQVVQYRADEMGYRILLCIGGCGNMRFETGSIDIFKGDCIFIPADSEITQLHGTMQFLDIRG